MMPRPPANRSDEPPSAEPAPAPSKAVAADDVPHDERAEALCSQGTGRVKELIPHKNCSSKSNTSRPLVLLFHRAASALLKKICVLRPQKKKSMTAN